MIIERLGEDFVRRLAKPRFVDTTTAEFRETLDAFVENNVRTEKRRHGTRTREDIINHSIQGIVGEFALKQIQGIEDNSPLVGDIRDLKFDDVMVDQTFNGFKFQVKTKKLGNRFWNINSSQCDSINRSMAYNDFFIVVGVKKETEQKWLAVSELLIDSKKIMRNIRSSQFKSWLYYYDVSSGRHNKDHVVLTDLLKHDTIDQELSEVA